MRSMCKAYVYVSVFDCNGNKAIICHKLSITVKNAHLGGLLLADIGQ